MEIASRLERANISILRKFQISTIFLTKLHIKSNKLLAIVRPELKKKKKIQSIILM